MNSHLSEEQLVLHYYGDDENRPLVARHLDGCESCRVSFAKLSGLLGAVKSSDAPEPLHGLEERVWQKIHGHIIESHRPRWFAFPARQWAYAFGITAVLALAFFAGRFTPRTEPPVVAQNSPEVARERILLITVADHLDRSQLMLLELINADTSEGLALDRERAAGLVADNRLFRQAASRGGDAATVAILDDLERILMEVENAPEDWTGDDLAGLRKAIENKELVFKVRVLGTQSRERVLRPKMDTVITTI
jgi:hypothetical protein